MKRVAFCLRGGVSLQDTNYAGRPINSCSSNKYVDYACVQRSIKKHIIDTNPQYAFDFFIHSWSTDLSEELTALYNPVSCKYERNSLYTEEIDRKVANHCEFSQVSQALAIKKVIELKEVYESTTLISYDCVIIYRPDVLLWKDMDLCTYELDKIYVNAHINKGGDFHFVMSSVNSHYFKHIYDFIDRAQTNLTHRFIRHFVESILEKPYFMDAIVPGIDQEVIRKLDARGIELLKSYVD